MRTCSVEGCERPHYAKAMCNMHWSRVRRNGDPSIVLVGRPPRAPAGRICSVDGCEREFYGKDLCQMHYRRLAHNGDVQTVRVGGHPRRPVLERLFAKVTRDGECWVWNGALTAKENGYGRIKVGSRSDGTMKGPVAHRVVYEALVGPIPEGLQLDHLCRNRRCVRPDHLEPVTLEVNVQRGWQLRRAVA